MAVLLIGMSIMAIMMTVALPTWKQLSRREKEAELVFRGEQYARAIQLFQAKSGPGTLPPSIDLLVDQRFLRKKFKDPITNDDFSPLVQVAAAAPGTAPGGARGVQPAGRQGGAAQPAATGAGQRGTPGAQPGTTPGAATAGGIMGVSSKSKEQSIRLYRVATTTTSGNSCRSRVSLRRVRWSPVRRGNVAATGWTRGGPGPGPAPPFGTGRQTAPPRGTSPNPTGPPFNPFPGGRQ